MAVRRLAEVLRSFDEAEVRREIDERVEAERWAKTKSYALALSAEVVSLRGRLVELSDMRSAQRARQAVKDTFKGMSE